MNMVDDATSTTESRMGKEETMWAAVGVLRAWITNYGVPHALYTDWRNVYLRKATPGEKLRGEEPVTQFGRMCQKLDIRIIAASSPQAKGRVERNNGTHQDRLIKKLRRRGIASYEAANRFLEDEYLPQHNRRFACPSAQAEDYHRRQPSARELRQIFRLETEARDQQRLGDPPWRPLLATASGAAALWAHENQGSGLSVRRRRGISLLSRPAPPVSRNRRAYTQCSSAVVSGGKNCCAEKSQTRSPLAVGLRAASCGADTTRRAARCPTSFRFALKSRATLQDAGQRNYIHRGHF
jgi:hypothetical protein